jgi:hypothetical protein
VVACRNAGMVSFAEMCRRHRSRSSPTNRLREPIGRVLTFRMQYRGYFSWKTRCPLQLTSARLFRHSASPIGRGAPLSRTLVPHTSFYDYLSIARGPVLVSRIPLAYARGGEALWFNPVPRTIGCAVRTCFNCPRPFASLLPPPHTLPRLLLTCSRLARLCFHLTYLHLLRNIDARTMDFLGRPFHDWSVPFSSRREIDGVTVRCKLHRRRRLRGRDGRPGHYCEAWVGMGMGAMLCVGVGLAGLLESFRGTVVQCRPTTACSSEGMIRTSDWRFKSIAAVVPLWVPSSLLPCPSSHLFIHS